MRVNWDNFTLLFFDDELSNCLTNRQPMSGFVFTRSQLEKARTLSLSMERRKAGTSLFKSLMKLTSNGFSWPLGMLLPSSACTFISPRFLCQGQIPLWKVLASALDKMRLLQLSPVAHLLLHPRLLIQVVNLYSPFLTSVHKWHFIKLWTVSWSVAFFCGAF